MQIGIITIRGPLLLLIAAGLCGWLWLSWYVLPRGRARLEIARGAGIAASAASVRLYQSLRSLAAAAALAPAVVAAIYCFAQWRIERSANDPTAVQAVIRARDLLEKTLGQFTHVALGSWITAVVLLSIIWLLARRSASRRRWNRAFQARQAAYHTLLAGETPDALVQQARSLNAERTAKLEADAAGLVERNRTQIQAIENARILKLPTKDGQGVVTSIAELRGGIAHIEAEVAALQAAPDEAAAQSPAP
jgi:hypothetical protein